MVKNTALRLLPTSTAIRIALCGPVWLFLLCGCISTISISSSSRPAEPMKSFGLELYGAKNAEQYTPVITEELAARNFTVDESSPYLLRVGFSRLVNSEFSSVAVNVELLYKQDKKLIWRGTFSRSGRGSAEILVRGIAGDIGQALGGLHRRPEPQHKTKENYQAI